MGREEQTLKEFVTIFPELTGNVISGDVKKISFKCMCLLYVWSSGVPLQEWNDNVQVAA